MKFISGGDIYLLQIYKTFHIHITLSESIWIYIYGKIYISIQLIDIDDSGIISFIDLIDKCNQ